MKHILACLLILVTNNSFSQIETDSLNTKAIKIKLKNDTTNLASHINLCRINVLDARDDTSGLGYFVSFLGVEKKYVFEAGFENELTTWYSNYLMANEKNKTGMSLFVNIKKLRLSSEVTPVIFENGHVGQPNQGWEKGVITKIEYFLQKDSLFTPLYRFDSIITLKQNLRRNADNYIVEVLKSSLAKLFTLNLDAALLSKKKITFNDILQVNNQTHNLPVYISTINRKGVYKTFDEFKMNAPSIDIFEFKKGKMGDILYVKENSSEYPVRDVWGYCDGKDFFINSGDKYSKLVRSGYSFYFEGIKAIKRKSSTKSNYQFENTLRDAQIINNHISGVSTASSSPGTRFSKNIKYYQVDMDTGKAY